MFSYAPRSVVEILSPLYVEQTKLEFGYEVQCCTKWSLQGCAGLVSENPRTKWYEMKWNYIWIGLGAEVIGFFNCLCVIYVKVKAGHFCALSGQLWLRPIRFAPDKCVSYNFCTRKRWSSSTVRQTKQTLRRLNLLTGSACRVLDVFSLVCKCCPCPSTQCPNTISLTCSFCLTGEDTLWLQALQSGVSGVTLANMLACLESFAVSHFAGFFSNFEEVLTSLDNQAIHRKFRTIHAALLKFFITCHCYQICGSGNVNCKTRKLTFLFLLLPCLMNL